MNQIIYNLIAKFILEFNDNKDIYELPAEKISLIRELASELKMNDTYNFDEEIFLKSLGLDF